MHHNRVLWILAALALAALGASCGGSDSPTGPGGSDPFVFDPTPGSVAVDVFDTFKVKLRTSDGDPVSGVFYVNELASGAGSDFAWWASSLGLSEIKAVIGEGESAVTAIWSVSVTEGETPPPGRVTQLSAGRGDLPGSINLVWERTAQNHEAIDFYRVYYAQSPIDPLELESVPFVSVPHSTESVQQTYRLEGLDERVVYYTRIQIVDLIGREAESSPEISSLSTGHYSLDGRVTKLVENDGGAEGFPSILIEMGDNKTLTDADGFYHLDNIPDVFEFRLSAKPTTDIFNYYSVLTDTLDANDQSLDLLLIKRSIVRLNQPVLEEVFMLEYLFDVAAKNRITGNSVILRWETYPIPIRVDPFVVSPGQGDIGASLVLGIDAWNDAAKEDFFIPVLGDLSYGADYGTVPSQPGSVLGEVIMIEPGNTQCLFQCIPEKVRVQMSVGNTPSVMDRVAVHELGHVLWLTHSRNTQHVLSEGVDGSSPLFPQQDEVLAARYIRHIPNGTDLDWYQEPEALP